MKVLIGPNLMGLEDGIPALEVAFPDVTFVYCPTRGAALVEAIVDADIYMGHVNSALVQAARQLKWIQSPSSGVDHFLAIPELVQSDVLLTSASGTHAICLAESVMAMILAFTRGVRDCIFVQQKRVWDKSVRPKLVELTGSTMGIIGLGKSGRALAKRARAFEMRVIAVDMYTDDKPDFVEALWGMDRLDDLLRASDYVVVTVPRTPKTLGMLGAEQLALMKPTAMLVGISRGGIIDQDAMADALREGRLAAAASDVFMPEPLPQDSELWAVENLLITPHIAGGTQLEGEYVLEVFTENLGRLLRGDLPLRNQVDKERGF